MFGKLIDLMADYRALGYGLLLLSFAGGLLFGSFDTTKSAPENTFSYRVVDTQRGSTMEKEINELAAQGCRPILAMSGTDLGGENTVVLECPK